MLSHLLPSGIIPHLIPALQIILWEPGFNSQAILRFDHSTICLSTCSSNVWQLAISCEKLPPNPPVDAVKLCDFITASPTPFQAVHNLTLRLLSAGFECLSERTLTTSSLKSGGKYFYTRNQSSIVAFTLPSKPTPKTAISFAVGHLDSPCLKIRPVSKKSKAGYLQVGVETYGGGIWHSWFDRDLSIAGRVIVATPSEKGENYTSRLVKIDRPLLRIPTLAIHLDGSPNVTGFKFNQESEFVPILGLVADQLNGEGNGTKRTGTPFSGRASPVNGDSQETKDVILDSEARHHPLLLAVLADELGCSIGDILDLELSLYDTQPSRVFGLSNEFISSPRLDNLTTSFSTIEALCESVESQSLDKLSDNNINCVILFDNEEAGSVSNQGAQSNLLPSFVERVVALPEFSSIGYHQLLANSFLISGDMGHAVNPNYEGKYEPNHAPRLNGGVVIKTNAKQKYTSNAATSFLIRRVAKLAGVSVQDFEIRNDSSCGSTVGPHLSTYVRTVDIGLAQLSMHSIRETSGSGDVRPYIQLFKTYFEGFSDIYRDLKID